MYGPFEAPGVRWGSWMYPCGWGGGAYKTLLEPTLAICFLIVCGCLSVTAAELSSYNRTVLPTKPTLLTF